MEMLELLKEYISKTPPEILQKEWLEIEEKHPEGINAFEYIECLEHYYSYNIGSSENQYEINISSKMTSNFSGSFFFDIIAL